ncbi:hypothetical protein BGW37DRAFT_209511 [Umbelopsis sp. PMI_123]|nr:hypothetical protein BGW37DRAFT_209511 [Umbelopsis sp. PMI_123]
MGCLPLLFSQIFFSYLVFPGFKKAFDVEIPLSTYCTYITFTASLQQDVLHVSIYFLLRLKNKTLSYPHVSIPPHANSPSKDSLADSWFILKEFQTVYKF